MQIKGKLAGVSKDWKTGRFNITIEMEEGNINELEKIKDKDLQIEIKRFTKHRSLNANRMLWECLGKIATDRHEDKWDIYLRYLRLAGKYTYILAKPAAVEEIKKQWRETEEVGPIKVNGQEAIQLICYYGSSTYNSEEFSKLLDAVIEDMDLLGLDKPTTEDMRRTIEALEEQECKA